MCFKRVCYSYLTSYFFNCWHYPIVLLSRVKWTNPNLLFQRGTKLANWLLRNNMLTYVRWSVIKEILHVSYLLLLDWTLLGLFQEVLYFGFESEVFRRRSQGKLLQQIRQFWKLNQIFMNEFITIFLFKLVLAVTFLYCLICLMLVKFHSFWRECCK